MRFVSEPARFTVPGSCVLIPGRRRDPRGFVDVQTVLEGAHGPIHIYLSATGIRHAAQSYPQLGLVDSDKLVDAQQDIASLTSALEAAQARIDELEATQERIAGLRRDGFTIQKVAGRPKNKVQEASA